MNVNPFLAFEGRCDEALAFYKTAVGAEVTMLMRFKDMPGGCPPGTQPDKVGHSEFKIGDSLLLASDSHCTGNPKFEGVMLTIDVACDAQAREFFSALGVGGKVLLPLSESYFASQFGILTDRFGLGWMIIARK